MTDWTHDQLQRDLADHLARPDRMIWQDMQLGPSGSPRPDVYTLQKSYTNPDPRAFEIKISASDFRADVTAGKAMGYLKFAGSVTFCMPKDLAVKVRSDLPAGAGLMVRSPGGWRTVKRATRSPVQIPEKALLKLLIDGVDRAHKAYRAKQANEHLMLKSLGEDVGKAVARYLRAPRQFEIDLDEQARKHEDSLQLMRERHERAISALRDEHRRVADALGIHHRDNLLDPYSMARALRELADQTSADARVRKAESEVASAAEQLSRLADQLRKKDRRAAA